MRTRSALALCLASLALCGCEDGLPPGPDFAGAITFDLGPPLDLPAPYGLDGNMLPVPAPQGRFAFSVTDETGAPLPARIVFRPPPGLGFADSLTETVPDQGGQPGALTGATVSPGVVGIPEGVLLQAGYGTVAVPPGSYHLFFTRGPEYEAAELDVAVGEDQEQAVNVELHRSVDTRGWLAADLHVHAARSFDSRLPLDRRVVSLIANGIEVLVPTEHHGLYDFSALLDQMGYGPDVAVSFGGAELNFRGGHAGVYPAVPDLREERGGSPPYQNENPDGSCAPPIVGTNCMEAPDAFALMHGLRPAGTIVTLNHAWFGWSDLGYFTNIGWGAGTIGRFPSPLPIAGTFDAMEVMNGYILHAEAIAYLFADWLYLNAQGYHVTALGSSDSHTTEFVYAGSPRTMLRLPTDRPGDVTMDLFHDALSHQRAVATTGPFVTVQANGGEIGDTVTPRDTGRVQLRVMADAPSWMSLDEVIVYKNGRELRRMGASTFARPRFAAVFDDEVIADTFYVVLALGHTPLPDDVAGEQTSLDRLPVYPIAITNPIYVDADRDGVLSLSWQGGTQLPWDPPMGPSLAGGSPLSSASLTGLGGLAAPEGMHDPGHEYGPHDHAALGDVMPLLYR